MTTNFYHGVEVIEAAGGARPVATVRSSVIAAVGAADNAQATDFPLNTPVLVSNAAEAAKLGDDGDLARAVQAMYTQGVNPLVVCIRVADSATPATLKANIIGKTNADGSRTGVQAILDCQTKLELTPRLLLAPGQYGNKDVVDALIAVAEKTRAVVLADGSNTTDAAAMAFAGQFASRRVYVVDPSCTMFDASAASSTDVPTSAIAAALIAKSDNQRGFWFSPSNQPILGVSGTKRAIDYTPGDYSSRAQVLNEANVATVINQQGFRLWGNRTCSGDSKWQFLSVVRTADMIHESLVQSQQYAVDSNITRRFNDQVIGSVQGYLDSLTAREAILGGSIWFDPQKNPANDIKNGQVVFSFDFTPPYPAERVTFESVLTDTYLSTLAA